MPRFLGGLYEDTQYLLSSQLSFAKDWLERIDERLIKDTCMHARGKIH